MIRAEGVVFQVAVKKTLFHCAHLFMTVRKEVSVGYFTTILLTAFIICQISSVLGESLSHARLVEVMRDQFHARGSCVVETQSDHRNLLKTALSDLRTVNYHGSVGLVLFLQPDIEDTPLERERRK